MDFNVFGKKIYIAKQTGTEEDTNGNDYPIYGEPEEYNFNVQPVTSDSELRAFGLTGSQTMRAICPRAKYENVFHEGDVAYLDGQTPEGEARNGQNANYMIKGNPLNQNLLTVIYFEKIVK